MTMMTIIFKYFYYKYCYHHIVQFNIMLVRANCVVIVLENLSLFRKQLSIRQCTVRRLKSYGCLACLEQHVDNQENY